MNTVQLTRHLISKDLRRDLLLVVVVWIFALSVPVVAKVSSAAPHASSLPSDMLLSAGLFVLIGLSIIRVVRLDAPGREYHFLSTRPVPWKALLASKTLFIILFLFCPVWIVKLALMAVLKIPVGPLDVALLMIETTIRVGALLAAAALFAFFLSGMARIILAMFVAAVGWNFLLGYLRMRTYRDSGTPYIPPAPQLSLDGSRLLVCLVVIVVTIAVVAVMRYRGKKIVAPQLTLIAGLGLGLLAWKCWPVDLSQYFAEKARYAGPLPAAMRDRVKVTFVTTVSKIQLPHHPVENGITKMSGGWNNYTYVNVGHLASLEGVDAPYYAWQVDYHSEITLKSGRKIECSLYDMQSHGGPGLAPAQILRDLAGFPMPADQREDFSNPALEIFHYVPAQFAGEDFTGATVKGEMTLEIRRAFIRQTAPLRDGTELATPRKRWSISGVSFPDDPAHSPGYTMLYNTMASTLRGDDDEWQTVSWGMPIHQSLAWLVVNHVKNEYLVYGTSGASSSSSQAFFYDTQTMRQTLARDYTGSDRAKSEAPIPADWGRDAEIIFFGTEACGRLTVPYEFKDVDLSQP